MKVPPALDFAKLFEGTLPHDVIDQNQVAPKLRDLAYLMELGRVRVREAFSCQWNGEEFAELNWSSSLLLFRFQERLGTPYDPEEQRDTFEFSVRIDSELAGRMGEVQQHLECLSREELIEKLLQKAIREMEEWNKRYNRKK
jgi:hypothetical protein